MMTRNFEDDEVLTHQEVGLLIKDGIAKSEPVVLQIGRRTRVVKWIGELDHDDPPLLPRWRIEIEK